MAFFRRPGVQELGHRIVSLRVVTESEVAMTKVSRCPGVQGDTLVLLIFHFGFPCRAWKMVAVRAFRNSIFNSGRTIIP